MPAVTGRWRIMRVVRLRPTDVDHPVGSFSGGNRQRAVIGRWLAADTRIFRCIEPTRGIDVGARAGICDLIERPASEGRAVIVVSSGLSDVIRLSERVLAMRKGRIGATHDPGEITEGDVARAAVPAS